MNIRVSVGGFNIDTTLNTATFAGSEENLEMMKFQVNFRDKKAA